MMISNFSGLAVLGGKKEERRVVNGEVVNFKYPAIVDDHYRYRFAVDNCNALSRYGRTKSQIGLDSAWGKTWCPIRVFYLFLACTEVNAYLAIKYLLKNDETFISFVKELSKS